MDSVLPHSSLQVSGWWNSHSLEHQPCHGREEKHTAISLPTLRACTWQDTDSCFTFCWSIQDIWSHLTIKLGIKYRIHFFSAPGRRINWIFMISLNDQSRFPLLSTKHIAHSLFTCKMPTSLPIRKQAKNLVMASPRARISEWRWAILSPRKMCGSLYYWSKYRISWYVFFVLLCFLFLMHGFMT